MQTRLSIGDFSRMTHLSVKALRHYRDQVLLHVGYLRQMEALLEQTQASVASLRALLEQTQASVASLRALLEPAPTPIEVEFRSAPQTRAATPGAPP